MGGQLLLRGWVSALQKGVDAGGVAGARNSEAEEKSGVAEVELGVVGGGSSISGVNLMSAGRAGVRGITRRRGARGGELDDDNFSGDASGDLALYKLT